MEKKSTQFIDKASKVLTIIFNPFFLPIYGMMIIFLPNTLFNYLPQSVKIILCMLVLIDNIVLPFCILAYLKHRGLVTNWLLPERKERLLPMFFTAICYSVTVYTTWKFNIPHFIKDFFIAMVVLVVFSGLISLWKKVSIHSTGMGALLTTIVVMSIKTGTPMVGLIFAFIMLSALVMSARLWLNAHEPNEIWLGFLFGTAISSVIYLSV